MISLAHPGSALIDLLNAEIDCREAEQPYWSAAIIHPVEGVGGGERRGPSRRTGWPNSLLTEWMFTRQGDCQFVWVTDRLDTSVGLAVWPVVTDEQTSELIGQVETFLNKWVVFYSSVFWHLSDSAYLAHPRAADTCPSCPCPVVSIGTAGGLP